MTTTDLGQTVDPQDKVSLVRLCLGDLDPSDQLFSDAVILAALEIQPVVTYAAAALAESAAARFAREVTITLGRTRVENSAKFKFWKEMAYNLRKGGPGDLPGGDGSGAPTLTMVVGGISKEERKAFFDDPDRIQPNFALEMDDNPRAQGQTRDDGSGRDC